MNLARHTMAAWALLCLVAACGGGGSEPAPSTAPAATADSTAFVQVEGCVVDLHNQPRATRVHAYGDDGRLIASTASTAQGVFQLRLPARRSVTVQLDAPDLDALAFLTGSSNLSMTGCLLERSN